MSNRVVFNIVAERAEKLAEARCSILSSTQMTVPIDVVLFADLHINKLEDQLGTAQDRIHVLKRHLKAFGLTDEQIEKMV